MRRYSRTHAWALAVLAGMILPVAAGCGNSATQPAASSVETSTSTHQSTFPQGDPPTAGQHTIDAEEASGAAIAAVEKFTEADTDVAVSSTQRMTYEEWIGSIDGGADPRITRDRPVWVVKMSGTFHASAPQGQKVPESDQAFATIDAYSGLPISVGLV